MSTIYSTSAEHYAAALADRKEECRRRLYEAALILGEHFNGRATVTVQEWGAVEVRRDDERWMIITADGFDSLPYSTRHVDGWRGPHTGEWRDHSTVAGVIERCEELFV